MKKIMQLLKNQKGLTLVELLAVIVILAVVAAIAVPSIGGVIENSRYNAVKADATNALNAAQLYFTDLPTSESTSVTVKELKDQNYLESQGTLSNDAKVTKTQGQPLILPGTATTSSGKKVTFNATLSQITADGQKGSSDGPFTIPKASE